MIFHNVRISFSFLFTFYCSVKSKLENISLWLVLSLMNELISSVYKSVPPSHSAAHLWAGCSGAAENGFLQPTLMFRDQKGCGWEVRRKARILWHILRHIQRVQPAHLFFVSHFSLWLTQSLKVYVIFSSCYLANVDFLTLAWNKSNNKTVK